MLAVMRVSAGPGSAAAREESHHLALDERGRADLMIAIRVLPVYRRQVSNVVPEKSDGPGSSWELSRSAS